MTANEKIFLKIKKLLTLASDKGATEAEAETAMRMAHELLTKHNLTMAEVNSHAEDSGIAEEIVNDFSPTAWKGLIWNATCHLYFCRHLHADFTRRKGKRHFIYGKADNAKTARLMGLYFIKTVKRITETECYLQSRTFKSDFLQGCAYRLALRMQEAREAASAPSNSTALVALYTENDRAISEHLKGMEIEEVECKQARDTNSAGFVKGWHKGGSISINQQLAGAV